MSEFKIVIKKNIDCFEESVSMHLSDGWELYGDFKIYSESIDGYVINTYYQSMVKIR